MQLVDRRVTTGRLKRTQLTFEMLRELLMFPASSKIVKAIEENGAIELWIEDEAFAELSIYEDPPYTNPYYRVESHKKLMFERWSHDDS